MIHQRQEAVVAGTLNWLSSTDLYLRLQNHFLPAFVRMVWIVLAPRTMSIAYPEHLRSSIFFLPPFGVYTKQSADHIALFHYSMARRYSTISPTSRKR